LFFSFAAILNFILKIKKNQRDFNKILVGQKNVGQKLSTFVGNGTPEIERYSCFDEFSSFAFMSSLRRITFSFTCKEEVQLNFFMGKFVELQTPCIRINCHQPKMIDSRAAQQYKWTFPLARVLTFEGWDNLHANPYH
jgi:hypothetical protein